MYDVVVKPLNVPFGGLVLVVLLLLAGVYWFARRAAKNPASAARSEARIDAGFEVLKTVTPAGVDALISQVQALNLVTIGREAYAKGQPLARALEEKAAEFLEEARRLKSGGGLQ